MHLMGQFNLSSPLSNGFTSNAQQHIMKDYKQGEFVHSKTVVVPFQTEK